MACNDIPACPTPSEQVRITDAPAKPSGSKPHVFLLARECVRDLMVVLLLRRLAF